MLEILVAQLYAEHMRSYRQYCALAKTLDVIGDRWTLLIVRELLLGPCRYTDLQRGLPGIATNLLADRLRQLEEAGIVRREAAPAPVATTLFHLTPWGAELRSVIHALVQWGAPLMADLRDDDAFRSEWLAIPAEIYLDDHSPDNPPVAIVVDTGGDPMVIDADDGEVRTRRGPTDDPDAWLSGPPHLVAGLLAGLIDLTTAKRRGVTYEGDPEVFHRVQPGPGPD